MIISYLNESLVVCEVEPLRLHLNVFIEFMDANKKNTPVIIKIKGYIILMRKLYTLHI